MLSNLLLKFKQFSQDLFDNNDDSEDPSTNRRSNSQKKYQQAPDIMTQAKPNSFVQPINPHKSSFTPTNRLNKLNSKDLLLPPKNNNDNKKTLILDLDETLVHSSFTPFEKNDIILDVDFEGVMYNIYVLVRPDAINFIKEVAKFFEVVIFTASISKYASPLLDILDKEKNIKYRLYRDHCTFINGIYIKDLKKLNRSLKDLIIVDNSPLAYAFDTDNGLPIKTWVEDPKDKELSKLLPILEFLAKTKDVRKFIDRFVFGNEILYEEAIQIIKIKELANKKFLEKNNDDVSKNNTLNNTNNINVVDKNKITESVNEEKENKSITNDNVNNNNVQNKSINNNLNINKNNQKKKNMFRLGAKNSDQRSFNLIKLVKNNKFDPSIPLTLSANTTKNLMVNNTQIQYQNNKNKTNIKDNISNNIKPISLKDIVCERNKSKKNKYVNLLQKFEGRSLKSFSYLNNNSQNKNNNINNNKNKLRISSSIGSYCGDIKNTNGLQVNRSSSTGNFLKFNSVKNLNHPKTPKSFHFSSKFLTSNGNVGKNKKTFNLFDGSNTTKHRNMYSSGSIGANIFKMKKNTKKK